MRKIQPSSNKQLIPTGSAPDAVDPNSNSINFVNHPAPHPLSIDPVPTSKDKIEQPLLAEDEKMFIPPIGSSVIISGKSGSGKSTLLANFIKDPRFYGPSDKKPNGWFDRIFLFSPTANGDDIQRSLDIPPHHVFTDLDEAPELLEVILNTQQTKLDEGSGAHTVEQFAIIFDDVIGDTRFMNSKEFTRCFYQVRHVNCTTFICTQHFKRVPRVCRLQANFIFFFQGSSAEVEIVVEEFAPPVYTKNEFRQMVVECTKEKFSFLTINMKVGWDFRFRKNLDNFVVLTKLLTDEKDNLQTSEQSDKKNKEKDKSKHKKYEIDHNGEIPNYIASVTELVQHGADEQETRQRYIRT